MEPLRAEPLVETSGAREGGRAPPPPMYWVEVASLGSGAGHIAGSASSLGGSSAAREAAMGPSSPPSSSAKEEEWGVAPPSCDLAEGGASESWLCVEATERVEGESSGSRGVIGGVGHVRGESPA